MIHVLKAIASLLLALAVLFAGVAAYFAVGALSREPPVARRATLHASLSRESCLECHAPIAAEWRDSFHYQSVTGPFWERLRSKGYARLFDALRIPCMNCHAPANVLDLRGGEHPAERREARELGVDCTSCHVSEAGIHGAGRSSAAPHETIPDPRFEDPFVTSTTLCARCHEEAAPHARTVTAWKATSFAAEGVTCIHCHMPEVRAPVIAGGPERVRRSHRFVGDKSLDLLKGALNASLRLTDPRTAVVRIVNDRVGHAFPASGMNQLLVTVTTRDEKGDRVRRVERAFGTRELAPGYLDFWPFLNVTKIPSGGSREIVVRLPAGHGTVSAEFRYRDWFAVTDRDLILSRISTDY